MANVSSADKLKDLQKKSSKEPVKTKKTKGVRVLDIPVNLHAGVRKACELSGISGALKKLSDQHKAAIQKEFFLLWTQEMWDNKEKPSNFNVQLNQLDPDGKLMDLLDSSCQFQVRFRATGIKEHVGKLPMIDCSCNGDDECSLCDGTGKVQQTVSELMIELLVGEKVGLSQEQAESFVKEEVDISDASDFVMKIHDMILEEEGTPLRCLGDKILSYMVARTKSQNEQVRVLAVTDEELEIGLKHYQVVTLKDELLDRIFKYADSLDQLRNLLTFINVTQQTDKFQFGISDEVDVKVERMNAAVSRYLVPPVKSE